MLLGTCFIAPANGSGFYVFFNGIYPSGIAFFRSYLDLFYIRLFYLFLYVIVYSLWFIIDMATFFCFRCMRGLFSLFVLFVLGLVEIARRYVQKYEYYVILYSCMHSFVITFVWPSPNKVYLYVVCYISLSLLTYRVF
jgi:hypothetical protein